MRCGALGGFFFVRGHAGAQPAMHVPELCGSEREFLAELDRCDEARSHLQRSKQLQGNREEIKAAKRLCAPGQRA